MNQNIPLKNVALFVVAAILNISACAQFYLRGEVRDESNNYLPNVKILLHSSGYLYHSGSQGEFGIPVSQSGDSLTLNAEGYQPLTIPVDANNYQHIQLKLMFHPPVAPKKRLLSLTKDLKPADWKGWTLSGETYSSLVENVFIPARRFPETGFAVTIDKASYSNVRRFLNMGSTIPPDAVRIEELLNYFNFDYTSPAADSTFDISSSFSQCPWNASNQLLFLKVCARKVDPAKIPPANLVFLVDVSGSMDMPNKLPLLKSAFNLLVNNLRDIDTVSIVVYGSAVGVWLPPTSGAEKKKIQKAIEDMYPGGPTPGEAGIRAAYRMAKSQFIQGGNNRVIIATDGDFNVGETSEEEMEKLITQHKQWGIYLTCLGVGMGNYKDSKLETLAKKGNGNFAYLDDEREAEKVLVREFTQTVYAVADDAYLNIKFNPALVKDYRLIGFDNKVKVMSDSSSEVQGGEVGSGHSLLALFEIEPASRDNASPDNTSPDNTNRDTASRDTAGPDSAGAGAAGFNADLSRLARVDLNYRLPHDSTARITGYDCRYQLTAFKELQPCYRFASSIALFGGLLKKSRFTAACGWKNAIEMAQQSMDPGDGMQLEFIGLIEKAKKIYGRQRKRPQE